MKKKQYIVKQPVSVEIDLRDIVSALSDALFDIVTTGISEQCDFDFGNEMDECYADVFELNGEYSFKATETSYEATRLDPPESELIKEVEEIDSDKLIKYVKEKLSKIMSKEIADKIDISVSEDESMASYQEIN